MALPFVNTYIKYFEYLAQKHPLILHQNIVGLKAFDMVLQRDIKELSIARMDINPNADFILLAVIPTDETEGSEDGNAKQVHTGGFFVLKKNAPRTEEKTEWWNAMYETQLIAYNILQRMITDSQNGHPLFHRQADRFENLNPRFSERVIEEKWYGYLVTFSFKNILPECPLLDCVWTDSGVTPKNL